MACGAAQACGAATWAAYEIGAAWASERAGYDEYWVIGAAWYANGAAAYGQAE